MVYKIIITGSFNSGKTEFIKKISEIDPITTDKPVSEDELREIKALTTVAMDFGRLTVDEDIVIHLYATPGQDRFDFIYPLLLKNALAIIILGDITNEKSVKDIIKYYKKFRSLKKLPTVVALTKVDQLEPNSGIDIDEYLKELPSDVPVMKINATNKEDVKKTVLFALQMLLEAEEEQEIV